MTTTQGIGTSNSTPATTGRPPATPIAIARNAPRRRSFAQGALAVLLIVIGALTAGFVVQQLGTTHEFLAVSRPVGRGAELTLSDLVSVRVNNAVGLKPIPSGQIDDVVGLHAVMALVPGTLLTKDQLTSDPVPGVGKQLLGLALEEDKMPVSRLVAGADVLLVILPDKSIVVSGDKPAGPDIVPPRTIAATVVDVVPSATAGKTVINVEVSTADAPTVGAMAADERIVITLAGG